VDTHPREEKLASSYESKARKAAWRVDTDRLPIESIPAGK
jgi:hypothetical protein